MKKLLLLFLILSSCKGIGISFGSGIFELNFFGLAGCFILSLVMVALYFYYRSKRERKDFEEYDFRIFLWSVILSIILYPIIEII